MKIIKRKVLWSFLSLGFAGAKHAGVFADLVQAKGKIRYLDDITYVMFIAGALSLLTVLSAGLRGYPLLSLLFFVFEVYLYCFLCIMALSVAFGALVRGHVCDAKGWFFMIFGAIAATEISEPASQWGQAE